MLNDPKTAQTKRRVRILWLVGCASLALAIMVLATTGWSVYSNWTQSRDDVDRAQSNRVFLRTLNDVVKFVEDAETGQRGYLLTGRDRYLQPYREALGPIKQGLASLSKIAEERADERDDIHRLQALAKAKLDELALTIHLRQTQSPEAAMAEVLTDRGFNTMTEIRTLAKTIADEQRADVTKRSASSERSQLEAIELAGTGGILLFCLMVAGFFALTSGAAEQAVLAERLADSREMFETTLTSIGDGVIATDTRARIEFINPEAVALTGWSRADAIQRPLDEVLQIVNETSREKVESPFVQVMRTGAATALANHTILIRRDGSEVPIDDSGAPIRNIYGELKGVVLVFRGIDKRRKAEASLEHSHRELLKANEELRQFSYAATHDLQEPLRTIVVFSQLLSRNYKGILDERGLHLLQTVEEAGHRMSSLINDLLTFTRVGTDSASTRVDVSAALVLEDTLVQLNGAIEETRAVVRHTNLPHVWAEPAQLSQLFQNLISNSIKYRQQGVPPLIQVSSTIDGEYATFQVSDNGIGFKQEYSDRIFLLFQRLHGRAIPGTGIGLALCRRIVERQGGRIWAISEENVGSTFFFTLPLVQSDVASEKQLLSQ